MAKKEDEFYVILNKFLNSRFSKSIDISFN